MCVCVCVQGLRNDLKDAMDKLDQEYLTQIAMQQVKIEAAICIHTTPANTTLLLWKILVKCMGVMGPGSKL